MKNIWIIFFSLFSFSLHAQDIASFLQGGNVPWTAFEFENMWMPKQRLDSGPDKTDVIYRHFFLSQQILKAEKVTMGLSARYQKLDLNKEVGILRDYYNIQFGGSFTYTLEDQRFWSLSYSHGSASDEPFERARDTVDSANFIDKYNERWFFVANYSNNRAFLNGVPLPGFFYVKEMTRERMLILGFPFLLWKNPLSERFSFTFFGLLPWSYRAKVSYEMSPFLKPYIGYEQMPQSYFRSDRSDRLDRFFWVERRVGLGLEGGVTRQLKFDLSTGLAFDRQFFEARNFADKKNLLYNLENGLYTSLTIKASF